MRTAVACVLAAAIGCAPAGSGEGTQATESASGVPRGDIKGTALVNKTLRARLMDGAAPATSRFAIEGLAGREVLELRGFLGQWVQQGTQTKFQGGEPNPFGLVLWHQVIARFAEGMGGACSVPGTLDVTFTNGTTARLHASVAPKIARACAEPSEDAARALFRLVVDDELPDEEAAFGAFFAGPDYASAPGKERVAAMFTAMLLNPHFLLAK